MSKTNEIETKNRCVVCGKSVNGFGMICDDCKEAIEWAKRRMKTSKKQPVYETPGESVDIVKNVDKVDPRDFCPCNYSCDDCFWSGPCTRHPRN